MKSIPIFHTRVMRQEMFNVFGRVASCVKPQYWDTYTEVLQVNVSVIAYTVVRFCNIITFLYDTQLTFQYKIILEAPVTLLYN